MRKLICLSLFLLVFTTATFAVKPPKVETLPDGYLIIGQYMIYRTQLNQENFDGAQLTTSDVQKMYYKSEFAEGHWFNIDESQELVEILMTGGGQRVDVNYLNTFKYSVQIDEEGNIIYFTEGENAMPIEAVIQALEAEKTKLKDQLDTLTGGQADAIADDITDVETRINAINKSIGIDNSAAEEKKTLEELLAVAMASGNKELVEALQEDLLKLNPKLSDSDVLVGKLTDLVEGKEALLAAVDQARRNGFIDLAAALEQELASKDALIDEAMKNAQVANNANPTAAVETLLNEAIAKSNALLVAGEEPLPDTLVAAMEKYIEILRDLLDQSFKKATLLAGSTGAIETDSGGDTDAVGDDTDAVDGDADAVDGDADAVDGDADVTDGAGDASGGTSKVGQLFSDLLEDKGISIQQPLLKDLIEAFADETIDTLDPLLTEDVLNKNQDFSSGELEGLLGIVDDQVFNLIKELVVLNRQLLEFLTTADLGSDVESLVALIEDLGLGQADGAGVDGNMSPESEQDSGSDAIDASGDSPLAPEETATLVASLSQMTSNTEALTDLLKAVNQLQASLENGQIQGDSLLEAIDGMILVAEELGNSGLVEDLKALRQELLLLQGSLHKNYYQDYISYKKDRYFLLKDYSGDKTKNHDTAFEDYTEAIKVYDKGINFIESNNLIDLQEATLEYDAWRLNFEGSEAERQRAEEAHEAYVKNKADLLGQSLAVLSRELERLYIKLGDVLEDPQTTDLLKSEVKNLRKGIEDLVIQLIATVQ